MGDNIVTKYFKYEADLKRVLSSGPWSFDKSFIIFQRLEKGVFVSSLEFDSIDLWVQIHDLPL